MKNRLAGFSSSIIIGIGANLPSLRFGSSQATCEAALAELERRGPLIVARSGWWESAPVPISDQPWYVNGVALLETALGPQALLALLHELERQFGRERRERNEARVLDLDLLSYGDVVRPGPLPPILPHPRLAERAFVLLPLAEILPGWRHPGSGQTVAEMIAALPADQACRPVGPPATAAAPRRSPRNS